MKITVSKEGKKTTLALQGRIDTSTSPEFDQAVGTVLEGTENMIFDFSEVEYISSAGLRVILKTQKSINASNGTLKLKNVSEKIMEIFDVTGFTEFLTFDN